MNEHTGPISRTYWAVPGQLLAGAYPGDPDSARAEAKIQRLLQAGVRVFVSLMEPDETDHHGNCFAPYEDTVLAIARETGLEDVQCLRFPIRDVSVPDSRQMDRILKVIEQTIQEGHTVYVHCWGGRGRTGIVVGCYLIRRGLAERETFVGKIAQMRRNDSGGGPSPETAEQIAFVREHAHE